MKGIAGTGIEQFADCPTCGQKKGARCVRVIGPCVGTMSIDKHPKRRELAIEAGWHPHVKPVPSYQPLMFANRDGKAVIHIKDGRVEIHGRDLSRLYFVMSQVMDDADRKVVADDLRSRGVIPWPRA